MRATAVITVAAVALIVNVLALSYLGRRGPANPATGLDPERQKKLALKLEKQGLCFSGMSPDGRLPEIVEWKDHPWFIGVQFHPELKSKPFAPHPLFADFVRAAVEESRLV